jgi:hypothetical protein
MNGIKGNDVLTLSTTCMNLKNSTIAQCWWLTAVILSTQEAEIRRIKVQSQLGQIGLKTSHG